MYLIILLQLVHFFLYSEVSVGEGECGLQQNNIFQGVNLLYNHFPEVGGWPYQRSTCSISSIHLVIPHWQRFVTVSFCNDLITPL